MRELLCPPGGADRLDKVVAQLAPDLSRSQARQLIAAGSVFVDGRCSKIASRPIRAGQRIRVVIDSEPVSNSPRLRILYEDADCIAIDKPSGMPSAPTRTGAAGTAMDTLREQLRGAPLWLVHRLDTGTSGVLLFAKTKRGAARWSEAFREQRVHKSYVALVAGVVPNESGEINLAVATRQGRALIDAAGRPARTAWQVVARGTQSTLLELQPHTGRMHQIRIHLQAIGNPVIGDRTYGGSTAPRLMLHACRLQLDEPGRKTAPIIESPLPAEFVVA